MYPLQVLDSAPKVRSFFLHQELNKIEKTDLISGTRWKRTLKLGKYIFNGNFSKLRFIYVESSTTIGSPLELFFLFVSKVLNKKIFMYIRDAYPLFPEEFPVGNIKTQLLYWGWKVSISVYKSVGTKLLFPTRELANLFKLSKSKIGLLPPGANVFKSVSIPMLSHKIGYLGELSSQTGYELMIEALKKVRKQFSDAQLIIVTRRDEVKNIKEDFFEYRFAQAQDIDKVLSDCSICLIARPIKGYNLLTLPVKLFDYMALGKAVVTTDLPAVAKIVEAEGIGLIAEDSAENIANKIIALLKDQNRLKEAQENAFKAIRDKHSWAHRAKDLYQILNNA
ncbi:MAG: glycosyltransferase family 4 protein [Candidatus Woykebacteria bacterium]